MNDSDPDKGAKPDGSGQDQPAHASDLHSPAEIAFEMEREGLRLRQEERKTAILHRRGFVVLLAMLVVIALVSTTVVVGALAVGATSLILPALAPLSGSAAAGALLWRAK